MSAWRARVHWGVIDDARARQRRVRAFAGAGILVAALVGVIVWRSSGDRPLSPIPRATAAGSAVGAATGDFAKAFVALEFSPIVGDELWAANGVVLARSNDDGAHWADITPPNLVGDDPGARIAGFASVGSRNLWFAATAAGDATLALQRGFAVEHSTNGGQTWRYTAIPSCSGCSMSLSFLDARRGWAFGSNGNLYATADGGTRWSLRAKAPASANALPAALDRTTATAGWLATGNALYTTNDGGRSWDRVSLPGSGPHGARSVIVGAPRFFDPKTGIVPAVLSDGSTVIDRTVDAGRRWSMLHVPVERLVGLPSSWAAPALSAGSANVWSLQTGTLVTADGGRSWTKVLLPPLYAEVHPLWQFAMTTATSGWLLASATPCAHGPAHENCGVPILLKTSDLGRHWQAITEPSS